MLRRPRRLLPAALIVFACAFVVGREILVSESPSPARPPRVLRPGAPPRSGDDGGFSIVLAKPDERYLIGRQAIVIDPTVPSGDAIAQVDFFVDGRLVCTDREAPYACESDFGPEIRRHTIIVTALTRSGRRAKVSLISRSGDLSENARKPFVMIPAVVLDGQGRPVGDLSVSDFTLLEDGERRPIVHFDSEPWPASIAVVVDASRGGAAARSALLRGAAAFAGLVPSHHALAFAEAGAPATAARPERPAPRPAVPAAPAATLEFSYDRDAFIQRLSEAGQPDAPPRASRPLAESLAAAAQGLQGRPPGGRVLVALIGGGEAPAAGPAEDAGPAAPAPPDTAPAVAAPVAAPVDPEPAPPDPALAAAALELQRIGAVVYLVVLGGAAGGAGAPEILRDAAAASGGEIITLDDPETIVAGSRRVAGYLLRRYLISYLAGEGERPGPRSLEVRARCAGCQVRARQVAILE